MTVFKPSTSNKHLETSGNIGDGTANTFTYSITDSLISAPSLGGGVYEGAHAQVYVITSSWQAANADTGGAYLFTVVRMPSGAYVGFSVATSSTTGFTSAPTISTAGVISIPLAIYYKSKVTRIDANQSKNMFAY